MPALPEACFVDMTIGYTGGWHGVHVRRMRYIQNYIVVLLGRSDHQLVCEFDCGTCFFVLVRAVVHVVDRLCSTGLVVSIGGCARLLCIVLCMVVWHPDR